MITYTLKKATYVVGDPAGIIKKTEEGTRLTHLLFETYRKDSNFFHRLDVDGIEMFMMRTAEGDGYYQGVGTDTGTIMMICQDDYKDDVRLNLNNIRQGMIRVELDDGATVSMERFNLYFSNGTKVITNSDDIPTSP